MIDVQRAGPSTGMPTKTEQSDLLMAIHGRHGESPLPVIAASTPGQCFEAAYEAARIAVRYRTPVILLSDLFLANSSEPWRIPDPGALAPIDPDFAEATDEPFEPYSRDEHGARPWAIPGTPGLGAPDRRPREARRDRRHLLRRRQPRADDADPGRQGRAASPPTCRRSTSTRMTAPSCSSLGWGSSRGAIRAAARRVRANGHAVALAHLHHLHPLPTNLGEVLHRYDRVLVPEMNTGQLAQILRAGTWSTSSQPHEARGQAAVRGRAGARDRWSCCDGA